MRVGKSLRKSRRSRLCLGGRSEREGGSGPRRKRAGCAAQFGIRSPDGAALLFLVFVLFYSAPLAFFVLALSPLPLRRPVVAWIAAACSGEKLVCLFLGLPALFASRFPGIWTEFSRTSLELLLQLVKSFKLSQ